MTHGGLFAPAVEDSPRVRAAALAGLRILAGLLWLYNVSWKRPPDFGESSGSGVYGFTADAVEYPVFAPYSWVVEQFVLPNFTAFGWMVLVVESLLAVLLLTGTFVRFAALLGVAQSLAIGLSVAQTPGEWPWAYWMMIGIHVVLLLTASGKALAVDRMRADAATGRVPDAALLRGWGIVMLLTGILAVVLALGEDPLASTGAQLGGPGLSVSLGSYNVLGAAAVLLVSGLMLTAALLRRRALAWAATGVAVVAAASMYAQLGRAEVWLGGSNTSAAYLLCAAVVSGAGAAVLAPSEPAPVVRTAAHG